MKQIYINKTKITKKLLESLMKNHNTLFNIFVKLHDNYTQEHIEYLKKTFNIDEITSNVFSLTVPVMTISKLSSLEFVEGVGMMGYPAITDSAAIEDQKGPKLLPAAKEAPEGIQAD
jgi:hypothetical protein